MEEEQMEMEERETARKKQKHRGEPRKGNVFEVGYRDVRKQYHTCRVMRR